jgi:peptidoglycan/xylan/chitin deacetylase (PgdA/CDA1 family)
MAKRASMERMVHLSTVRVCCLSALAALVLAPAAAANDYRGPVPILTYHELRSPPKPPRSPSSASLWVKGARFSSQVRGLARAGFRGVTLSQVWDAWHGGPALPSRPVVVSFDDGYAAQYSTGARVLRDLGWPAVLNLEISRVDARGGLSSARVRTLVKRGWEIASHTYTHPDLTKLSASDLQHEVADSRAELRRRFGGEVAFFCYPFGRTSPAVEDAVALAGYSGATTVSAGVAAPSTDPLELPRVTVRPRDTGATLAQRLTTSVTKVSGLPSPIRPVTFQQP